MDFRNVFFFRFEHLWTMFNPFHVIFGKYGLDDMRIGQWYWQTPHLLSMAFKPRCNMWPQGACGMPWWSHHASKAVLKGVLGFILKSKTFRPSWLRRSRSGCGAMRSLMLTKNAGGFAKSDFALRQSLIYHGRAWLPKATTLIFTVDHMSQPCPGSVRCRSILGVCCPYKGLSVPEFCHDASLVIGRSETGTMF